MIRRPPICTLCPYTTLFRSGDLLRQVALRDRRGHLGDVADLRGEVGAHVVDVVGEVAPHPGHALHLRLTAQLALRSEEHTSELQSRQYLVCRLLLEKQYHLL